MFFFCSRRICTTAYEKLVKKKQKKPYDRQTNVTKHLILNHLKLEHASSTQALNDIKNCKYHHKDLSDTDSPSPPCPTKQHSKKKFKLFLAKIGHFLLSRIPISMFSILIYRWWNRKYFVNTLYVSIYVSRSKSFIILMQCPPTTVLCRSIFLPYQAGLSESSLSPSTCKIRLHCWWVSYRQDKYDLLVMAKGFLPSISTNLQGILVTISIISRIFIIKFSLFPAKTSSIGLLYSMAGKSLSLPFSLVSLSNPCIFKSSTCWSRSYSGGLSRGVFLNVLKIMRFHHVDFLFIVFSFACILTCYFHYMHFYCVFWPSTFSMTFSTGLFNTKISKYYSSMNTRVLHNSKHRLWMHFVQEILYQNTSFLSH